MMTNKSFMLITLIIFLFTGIQTSSAQSPEELLKEMRRINPQEINMKEYFSKIFPYYDTPSQVFLHHYLQSSADELNMSLDDYYELLDGVKGLMNSTGFDVFSNLMSSGNFNNLGFSNYSQFRSIDNENTIEITESANLDLNKYVDFFVKKFPKMFDAYSKEEMKTIIIDKLPANMYKNGVLTNKILFVKENSTWKIHITKQQANIIFPENKYVDDITESTTKPEEVTPKPNESTTNPDESTPKPNESTTTNTLKNKVENMLAQAQQYEKDKDIESAAKKYKQIAINYPYSKYTPMCIKKGAIDFFRLKQYNNVINIIKLSNSDNKQNTDNLQNLYNYLLGMSYYLKEKPDYNNVVFYLEKMIRNQSKNKNTQNALSILGICYENMQHYNEAIEIYKKIYNIHDANQLKALYKIGYLYSLKNEFDMSNKYLTQCLRDFPKSKFSDIANYRLGKNHFSSTPPNYDSAIIFFHSALSNTTDQELIVKLYYNLGECYFKLKKWDACKASFSKVIKAPLQYNNPEEFVRMRNTASIRLSKLKDEIPKDYYHRGIAALDSSEYQNALEYFEKIIKRNDEEYYAHSILYASWCQFKLKYYDNAYKLLKTHNTGEVYNIDPQKYQYIYAFSLLYKKYPDYSKALSYLHHLNFSESPSKENKNLIFYSIGLCYEKTGHKKQAVDQYELFVSTFKNDKNIDAAKKAISKLKKQLIKEKVFTVTGYYTYKKEIKNDSIIITIIDLEKGCFLQPDAVSSPGLIYIPVNINKVHLNQKVEIILQQTPFIDSRLAYLNITTDIPKSNLNVFKPSISIQVSQDYECCKNGTNKIEEKNILGIWDEGLISSFDYSKPLKISFVVNSLGRSFHGNKGAQKTESPLLISIFFGNSANVVTGLINNAKKKGTRILYISGMGTD